MKIVVVGGYGTGVELADGTVKLDRGPVLGLDHDPATPCACCGVRPGVVELEPKVSEKTRAMWAESDAKGMGPKPVCCKACGQVLPKEEPDR